MLTFFHPQELNTYIQKLKKEGKRIGFFPTMGALHAGHLSLLKASKSACDISVCSIFVNPTQFTNPDDLAKYPRTERSDSVLLEKAGCDILFMPDQATIYAGEKPINLHLGSLTRVFEGASRPGHFEGVARIVRILFECVQPDDAYFGLKDYQQCLVIDALVKQLALPVALHFVPTKREADGLAMSSRNQRLNAAQREAATAIYRTLVWAKDHFGQLSPGELEPACVDLIEKEAALRVDYFSLADARTLEPVISPDKDTPIIALTAVFAGDIRLIDNLLLK
ncbi:MAG: pantoate--beta-alanine ligase [Bacteroidia bacterium]